jgi:hypothetical protein
MPTYISLLRYTQQGIAAIKQGPTRLDAAKQAYKKAGGELKALAPSCLSARWPWLCSGVEAPSCNPA